MTQFISRRDALLELGALFAIPLVRWPDKTMDPLAGTIADYQTGRARGSWSGEEVTKEALERARAWCAALNAIDELSDSAMDEARESDRRARRGRLRGPLDGAPV